MDNAIKKMYEGETQTDKGEEEFKTAGISWKGETLTQSW